MKGPDLNFVRKNLRLINFWKTGILLMEKEKKELLFLVRFLKISTLFLTNKFP